LHKNQETGSRRQVAGDKSLMGAETNCCKPFLQPGNSGGIDMFETGVIDITTAAEHVYNELKRRIFLKELRPGQRLP